MIRMTRAACWREQVGWWRQALAGAPEELALPATGRARPCPATAGITAPLEVPGPGARGAGGAGPQQGVTMFMVVQAGLAVLLSRLGAGTISRSVRRWRGGPMRLWMSWSGSL